MPAVGLQLPFLHSFQTLLNVGASVMVRHSITLLAAISTIHTLLPVNADFLNNHLPQAHHHRAHHANLQRDVVALPSGWAYTGCRGEPSGGRMLSAKLTTSTVSPGLCSTACNSAGFTAAGMQYGNECWCGYYDQLNSPSTIDESRCSMACSGEHSFLPVIPNASITVRRLSAAESLFRS